MSSNPVDKQTFSENEITARIAGYLDKKDGNPDNKISKEEWNLFAEYSGLDPTDKDFVTLEEAQVGLDTLVVNNPEKIVNYSREHLGRNIKLHKDETTALTPKKTTPTAQKGEEAFLENLSDSLLSKANPAVKMVYKVGKYSKTFSDKAVAYLIRHSDVETIQSCIQTAADVSSPLFPVASQLLHISATPSELRLGKHDDYTVLSPKQTKARLGTIGMHENDTNAYGKINEHLTSDQMTLKTVEFNSKSDVSQTISDSLIVKAAINTWEADGRPMKKYYGGTMNNTGDELMAINSCLISVTGVEEKGNQMIYRGYVEDVYDFGESYTKGNNIKSKVIDSINRAAFAAQEVGAIKKYRVLIPFSVTVSKKS